MNNKIKSPKADIAFRVINDLLLVMVLILVLYPMIFVVSASFSDPNMVAAGKVVLLPKGFTLEGYKRVLNEKEIWTGYKNTIIYTVTGTALSVTLTLLCAYPLSRKDLRGRNIFVAIMTFTMFFSGGLIPLFMLVKKLKMLDTIWAIILPGAVSTWNVIITRTYIQSIPETLQEAAMIDGCDNVKILTRILIPLCAPIIAVVALYYGVGQWNSYFSALVFINSRTKYPLQLILREILVQQQMSAAMTTNAAGNMEAAAEQAKIAEVIKYAVMIVSCLPVLVIYPFLQKYFVKGVMVGAIKG